MNLNVGDIYNITYVEPTAKNAIGTLNNMQCVSTDKMITRFSNHDNDLFGVMTEDIIKAEKL